MVETIVVGYQKKFEAYGFNHVEDDEEVKPKASEEEKKSEE